MIDANVLSCVVAVRDKGRSKGQQSPLASLIVIIIGSSGGGGGGGGGSDNSIVCVVGRCKARGYDLVDDRVSEVFVPVKVACPEEERGLRAKLCLEPVEAALSLSFTHPEVGVVVGKGEVDVCECDGDRDSGQENVCQDPTADPLAGEADAEEGSVGDVERSQDSKSVGLGARPLPRVEGKRVGLGKLLQQRHSLVVPPHLLEAQHSPRAPTLDLVWGRREVRAQPGVELGLAGLPAGGRVGLAAFLSSLLSAKHTLVHRSKEVERDYSEVE